MVPTRPTAVLTAKPGEEAVLLLLRLLLQQFISSERVPRPCTLPSMQTASICMRLLFLRQVSSNSKDPVLHEPFLTRSRATGSTSCCTFSSSAFSTQTCANPAVRQQQGFLVFSGACRHTCRCLHLYPCVAKVLRERSG